MKRILALLLAVFMLAGIMPIYAQAETECEHEYFTACDSVCMNCGEVTRESTHSMTLIPGVEAIDCQNSGTLEHYKCSKCGGTYYDEEGLNALNPWYITITVDCVRPEGSADCAIVPCEVCGEEVYGYGEHDLGDSFACQGGTCVNCGEKVYGWGCENDGPYCMDGHCLFCGEAVEGWGHENGAWAPCSVGECAYGCGLKYEPTAEHDDDDGDGICNVCWNCAGDHTFDFGFDPCYGGSCSVCWAYVEGAHSYDYDCDVDCNVCGENREVEHTLVHAPAVAGSCIENGHIEFWYCSVCGSAWLDAECQLPTNLLAVVLPGPSHPELIHYEAVEATCTEDGNIEYWYCELCGWAFLDEYGRFDEIRLEDTIIPAAHTFANPCDTYCVVCEEDVRDPAHSLTYVPGVEAADCQTPGNIEHWHCEVCDGYFNDAAGINQLNPWYIPVTADCVRPEGSADCASVPCEVCGEEIYGYGEHDVLACKGGTCGKCGDYIDGYGCANYDTPACMDGVCYYCGEAVEGFGHENGAWAPCSAGECAYGCGLEYPATAEHVDEDGDGYCDTCWSHLNHTFDNGFDPCYGGECDLCWTYVPGEHNVIHVEASEPTCTENGNIEHWYCDVCGAAWADEAMTQVTNLKNVIIPALGHDLLATGLIIEPTCTQDGISGTSMFCNRCAEWIGEDTVLPALGHDYVVSERIEPTCTENGYIVYICSRQCNEEGYTYTEIIPASHTVTSPCDNFCAVCGEAVTPHHELTYVPGVDAVDCQTPGNIEHWYCEVCGGYFNDAEGISQMNPWYIPVTADCVRPEGAPDCAIVNCLVCGEEVYGYGEHDVLVCKGGTCGKCGEDVMGYGCANDGPYCMDGHCLYCGEFVEGWGHENGAWAPCSAGECAYGCGLNYEPTGDHVDEDGNGICDACWNCTGEHTFEEGFYPCYGGTCSKCWAYVERHDFEDSFTVDKAPTEEEPGLKSRHCKHCDATTDETEIPVIKLGDINGDNRVNSRDLLALKKYLANSGTIEYIFNADIDGNGRINSLDTMRLNKLLKP